MLNIYRSNRGERLVDALAEILKNPVGPPTEPEWIAVPSAAMRTWLGMELSRRFGIWAGAEMPFPRALIEHLLSIVLGDLLPDWKRFSEESITWSIMARLPEFLDRSEFAPLAAYIEGDTTGLKSFQLAKKIAHAFDEYAAYRPEMVLDWERTQPDNWQSILWNSLTEQHGSAHIAGGARLFFDSLERLELGAQDLPRRISLMGISNLPPLFMQILSGIGLKTEVNLFVMSPSKEYWAHIRSKRGFIHDLGGLSADLEKVDEDLHIDHGNPLLASLGRIGRDFQGVLEEIGPYDEPAEDLHEEPISNASTNLLRTLQSDVLHLRDRRIGACSPDELPKSIKQSDMSLLIHSCHSPMREVEILRDQLLALFDDENLNLTPEDVLVMMPDIETYAPFIDAVFASESGGAPEIPYRITGLGPRQESEVQDAFFSVLDLIRGRVTVHEVFDLLRTTPVCQRFGFDEAEIDMAQKWIENAGVRWGVDKMHRARHGQPEFQENTWRFGLNRLLLGYAMPGEERNLVGETLAYDGLEGSQTEILGKLAEFHDVLFKWIEELSLPRTAPMWTAALKKLLEETIVFSRVTAFEHQRISKTLDELSCFVEQAQFDGQIDLDVICEFLSQRLEATRVKGGRLSGGVVFSGLLPMRSIPSKVVCLMGMNDRDFPRSRQAPSFDLMVQNPRMGDRSVRNDDRYLFLLALLAARERFIITYIGQDIQDNSTIGPSVVVSELIEVIQRGFYVDNAQGTVLNRLIVKHPLQPFSSKYFGAGGDPRLFSYSVEHFEGARAMTEDQREIGPFLPQALPLSDEEEYVVTLNDLTSFYKLPCRYLLAKRLGIYIEDEDAPVEEREPIEHTPLDEYTIGSKLLKRGLDGEELDGLFNIFRASGVLPLGTTGRIRYEEIQREVESIIAAARTETEREPLEPLDIDLTFNAGDIRARVVGRLQGISPSAMINIRYGSIKAKNLLELWIHHLALNSVTEKSYPKTSVCLGRKDEQNMAGASFSPIKTDPLDLLADLVHLYWLGQSRPLRLFPQSSLAYAELRNIEVEEQKAFTQISSKWQNSYERKDPSVALLFRTVDPLADEGVDPLISFRALALRVFSPLIENLTRL
ncbi:MAG: exodeoxyribonuclease V subunit gamma [Proteobacteria bacterium]|nr:exodeoxyribonuclease V subunit gamma [Pseudomonadota bacterium]